MGDASVKVLQNTSGDRPIDNESVSGHVDGTVYRQRIEIAGASLAEIAAVTNAIPMPDDYGLVIRPTPPALLASKQIYRHLSDDGLTTGGKNAIGNYSATAKQFWISPGAGNKMAINRLIVLIEDIGVFDSGKYGNAIVLANGFKVEIRDGDTDVILDLTDGHAIQTNVDWAHHCFDINIHAFGSGNQSLAARWTFSNAGHSLLLKDDDRFTIELNDDFSGLVEHQFIVHGFIIP